MKIKKSIFCVFCFIELLGMIIIFWEWKVSICLMVMGLITIMISVRDTKFLAAELKNCPKCRFPIPLKARICPECGYSYSSPIKEEELLAIIEREQDQEHDMSSEDIDCNFEKIEEVVVSEIASYDGDIEEFLLEREKKSEFLEI